MLTHRSKCDVYSAVSTHTTGNKGINYFSGQQVFLNQINCVFTAAPFILVLFAFCPNETVRYLHQLWWIWFGVHPHINSKCHVWLLAPSESKTNGLYHHFCTNIQQLQRGEMHQRRGGWNECGPCGSARPTSRGLDAYFSCTGRPPALLLQSL